MILSISRAALVVLAIFCPIGLVQALDMPGKPAFVWTAEEPDGKVFGKKTPALTLKGAREKYDPSDGFTVAVRLRPEGFLRLGGIVHQYHSSRTGSWYLSQSVKPPYRKLRAVLVAKGPRYVALESNVLFEPGKWRDAALTYDGKDAALLLDGKIVARTPVGGPLLVPPKHPVRIGALSGTKPFQGRIKEVRLYDKPIALPPAPPPAPAAPARPRRRPRAVGNYLRNSSFETGASLAEALAWNRMPDVEYVQPEKSGWRVVRSGAFHGKQCLKGDGSRPLLIPAEVWARIPLRNEWTFSVHLRADADNVPCELQLGSYLTLRQEYRSRKVVVGRKWKRFDLAATRMHFNRRRQGRGFQGPMNFWVKPLKKQTVYVDAAQWRPGKPVAYAPSPRDAQPDGPCPLLKTPPRPAFRPIRRNAAQRGGVAPVWVYHDGKTPLASAPVELGVPFPAGRWNGQGRVVLRDADGRTLPAQTEVLTQWHGDASLQAMGLCFEAPLKPGRNTFALEFDPAAQGSIAPTRGSLLDRSNPNRWTVKLDKLRVEVDPRNGALWESVTVRDGQLHFAQADIRAQDFYGKTYDSLKAREVVCEVEKDGPVHVSIAKRGLLTSADGKVLLQFIARLHLWRKSPALRVELTLLNPRASGSVAVREVYWRTREAPGGRPGRRSGGAREGGTLVYYRLGDRSFHRAGVSDGKLGNDRAERRGPSIGRGSPDGAWQLDVLHGWQRHPTMLTSTSDGEIKAFVWPGRPVMPVEFSRGMSVTRECTLTTAPGVLSPPAGAAAERLAAKPPVAMSAPSWFAKADLLLPVHQIDAERFPFMHARLTDPARLGRLSPETIETRRMYGVFDYGDNHGDGGWGNLESYSDHCIIMLGASAGDPATLRQGLVSASHYRDMDVNQVQGYCNTHSQNHVMGGGSFSHSWPQGVFSHYLLTGSRRSLEVSLRVGEYMLLKKPVIGGEHGGGRTLGRFFLNLADIYQITGDPRYLKQFMAQVKFSEDMLKKRPKDPDQSFFTRRNERLVPYHCWYGCIGLMKMARVSGVESLDALARREVAASLKRDLYELDQTELWPGVSFEAGWPIICADFARHRGSLFYPVMTAYSKMTGDPKWGLLALRAAYAGAIEGRAVRSIQAVLASAALSACPPNVTEAQLIADARKLLWQAASPKLLNGDFTMSRDYWRHWRPFPGKSLAYHTGWQRRRKKMVALDTKVYKVNAPSLRIELNAKGRYNRGVALDSARVRLEPGRYRAAWWMKFDPKASKLSMRVWTMALDGAYGWHHLYRSQPGPLKRPESTDMKVDPYRVSKPDAAGWRRCEVDFRVPGRRITKVVWLARLKPGAKEGPVWIDGISITRLP